MHFVTIDLIPGCSVFCATYNEKVYVKRYFIVKYLWNKKSRLVGVFFFYKRVAVSVHKTLLNAMS